MDLIKYIWDLRPVDMSVVMFVLLIVDLWSALTLSLKRRSVVSKTLIKGFTYNLLIIFTPFILRFGVGLIPPTIGDKPSWDYVQVVSLILTLIYSTATVGSIIANYTAAFPQASNMLTKFGYKYLPVEIQKKIEKHGGE